MLTFLEITWLVLCVIGMVVALSIVRAGQAIVGAVISFVVGNWILHWLFAPTYHSSPAAHTVLVTNSQFPPSLAWGLVLIVVSIIFFFGWGFTNGFLQAMWLTPVLLMVGAVLIEHFVKGAHL